jgi:hypothetical protein
VATRFYLSHTNADINFSGALSGGGLWEQNPFSVTTKRCGTTKRNTAVAATSGVVGTGTNPNDVLFYQAISDPLAAQTISGTFSGQVLARENTSINTNATSQIGIFVVNAAGTRVATLYGGTTSTSNEFNNPSATNRPLPAQGGSVALTSYDCAGGDRIVIEIGARISSTRTGDTVTMYFGDDGTDLPTGTSGGGTTSSPWVELSGNLTFGYTPTGSFTANSVIKKTQTGSFTINASIVTGGSTITDAFGIDAVIQKTQSGSFTANAIVKKPASGSFTIDAWRSIRHTGSFTIDAAIRTVPAIIVDDPFDDPATVAGTWNRPWDQKWTMIGGIENSTAELGRNPTKGAFVYDDSNTVLDSERGGYIHRRTYQRASISARVKIAQASNPVVGSTRIAVYLRHSGETGGMGYYDATYVAVELLLNADNTTDLQIRSGYNSVVYGPVSLHSYLGAWADDDEFYIKGFVKGSRVKGKVWRVGDPEPRWQINQVITGLTTQGYKGIAANTKNSWKPVEWNVRTVTAYNLDFSVDLDAIIKATQTASFTANSVLKATRSSSFTIDAVKAVAGQGSFTIDAVIKKTVSGSFSLDANLFATRNGAFNVDALVKRIQAGSFSIDAHIDPSAVTQSGSFTADAILERVESGSFSAASVLKRTASASFSIASVLQRTNSGSFQVDADIRATGVSSFTVDAWLVRRTLVSFTADAILQRERQNSATVDAIVRRERTGSFDAAAVLRSQRTGSFSADALIKATRQGSFTLASVKVRTISGSFTIDAVCGLAVLPDIDATFVIPMIEATTEISQLGFTSSMRMIEAETGF